MEEIRIKNLRSLQDTNNIKLRPLTVLVGENSSGKSTFLRTLPLFRQSVEATTRGPILWYGRLVDFGTFSEAKCNYADDDSINFSFKFKLDKKFLNRRMRMIKTNDPLNVWVSLNLIEFKEGETRANSIEIGFNNFSVRFNVNKDNSVSEIVINGKDYSGLTDNFYAQKRRGILYTFYNRKKSDGNLYLDPFGHGIGTVFEIFCDEARKASKYKITANRARSMLNIDSSSNESILQSFINNKNATIRFRRNSSNWTTKSPEFICLRDKYLLVIFFMLIEACDEYIYFFSKRITYVAPIRAVAERYYRPQDLNVEEVDFQGKNLSMFLNNLTESEKSQFNGWMEENFGFHPRVKSDGGHLSIRIKYTADKDEFNLADMGFGFSQVLPIVSQIWSSVYKRHRGRLIFYKNIPYIFAIEQPELHLHPKFQARLIDAIINVIKQAGINDVDIKFIIETHSETIINALGRRIYKDNISTDNVNIVLFEKEKSNSPTKVRQVSFDNEGILTEWPYGFFEEDV